MKDSGLHGVAVYNPGLWSRQELKANFTARQQLLDRILDDLRREQPGHTPQHRLVLGLRGMGKTFLLRRIAVAVEEDQQLAKQWLPLTFPEEQYNVARQADLWLNCLDALGDMLEHGGREAEAAELDERIAALPVDDEAALAALLDEAAKQGKRLLLLVDNIDLVLQRLEHDHWSIRDTLQSRNELMIIGASSRAMEASYHYDAAFYDFFKVDELRGLTEEEMRGTLKRLSELGKTPHVAELLESDPARLRTLHTITGGNPRTVVLLYGVLSQGLDGDVRTDLEGLLDRVTPLYKARFEELPQQSQQLVDALSINWDPMTARQLADRLSWDVNKVSSLLARLGQQAVVQKVKPPQGKRAAFQIAERFFNIWYLMRASRRVRQKLIWLVRFLRMFFGSQELADHARSRLGFQAAGPREAEYSLALSRTVDSPSLCAALETHALEGFLSDDEASKELPQLLDLEGEDAPLRPRLERMQMLRQLREKITRCLADLEIDGDQFCDLFLGTPGDSLEIKWEAGEEMEQWTASQWQALYQALLNDWQHYQRALTKYCGPLYRALASGYMAHPADVEGAAAAAEQLQQPTLPAVAWAVRGHLVQSQNPENAEEAYRQAIKVDPEYASPWNGLGVFYQDHLQRSEEAEKAYRRAIKVDPGYAYTWNNLGNLYQNHLHRFEEAEKAYRQAVKFDPGFAYPWNGLGNLLSSHLHRSEEAEEAYRQAIKVDVFLGPAHKDLAWFLYKQKRDLHEGVRLARKAVELNPEGFQYHYALATLLISTDSWDEAQPHLRRFMEEGNDAFHEEVWNDTISLFREAVHTGNAADALALLDETTAGQRWRPLREALAAVVAGTPDHLNGVAPEVRQPAQQILADLTRD